MKKTGYLSVTLDRLRILSLLVPLIALAIIVRLFYWQIIRGPSLRSQAIRQHQETVILASRRGDIYDANLSLLVGSQNLYHLFVYKPQLTADHLEVVEKLAPILAGEPPEASPGAKVLTKEDMVTEMKEFLGNRLGLTSNWVSLKHYLSEQKKQRIVDLNISGLGFEDEYIRYYPEASLSAQVLGFVGSDVAGQPQGYFGLEGYFDRQLRGREGKILAEKDALGNPILIGKYNLAKNISGRSLVTTIDKKIQYLVESFVKDGLVKYQARAGNAIVMETGTGRILAMAAFPNYDPSHFADFDQAAYRNPNVANLFEPGSVFKVLVAAAAINEKVITADSRCDICGGPLSIGQFTIKTWNEKYYPDTTMTDVLVHSDNIGMVFMARKLGIQKFTEYLDRFGFGERTGIELQDEAPGQKRWEKEFREIDLATNSFGQGIAVTPIQVVTAVNAIANGGLFVKPTVISRIIAQDKEITPSPAAERRVLEPEAAVAVREMMVAAVNQGEAKWAKPKGVEVAGKTGTAQVPIQGHYDPEKTIASFVGFFPARNPKYTMLVSLTEPQTSQWGSETAAPLWFAIANQLIMQNPTSAVKTGSN